MSLGTAAPMSLIPVVDERLRTTSLCLAVASGSRDDPDGLGGAAHLLEHLVMSLPLAGGASFSERVERLGGRANAETGLEQMLYYAQVHADDADEAATLLLRAFTAPGFTQSALDDEREVVLQELAAAAADPADAVQDAVLAALFPGHPLGRPVGGDPRQLRAVTLDDIRAAHAALVNAPAALTVVGPRIPGALRGLPRGTRPAPAAAVPPAPLRPVSSPAFALPAEADYSWLCLGARSPRAGSPLRPAYTVLAQLLGSSPSSLLYRALRGERQLSYAFQAWDRGYREAGAWRVLIGTGPDQAGEAVEVVRGLLARLAERGPDAADLQAARRQAAMGLVLDAEEPMERARLTADRTAAGTLPWSPESEAAALRAVTADRVRAAAADVAAHLLVTVRPEAQR
ncbi:insulinase family protein [Streptomyces sp. WAC05292]|uniref:M16 family metallopeptidase n=1 Tax=Streptomyces sp. WAC05292 TaxID=2487418 RepID=UPI000F736E37|nr:pitrilysin family protein [Streptomyces sp. WAC05292]RSS93852.1 insulinase family protein [Streptomyces sp. WAC05292]